MIGLKAKSNNSFTKLIKNKLGEVNFIGANGEIQVKDKPYLTEDIGVFDEKDSYYIEAVSKEKIYLIVFDVDEEGYSIKSCRKSAKV